MKKNLIPLILFCGVLISGFIILSARAQENSEGDVPSIQYPISELGNCGSKEECKNYCDKSENVPACLDFAVENNLMPKEKADMARKMVAKEMKGPGECGSKEECESYCDNISNIDECVSFAEENNIMSEEELGEARKVRDAVRRGVKPPACGGKKSCDSYCSAPENMEECMTFAEQAGFMGEKEREEAKKFLAAVKRGVKPPACKGKDECDAYCSEPDNAEECMTFAMEAGFMSEEEKEGASKMLQALKRGVKPLPCKGKDECDAYCEKEENFETCVSFAEAAGFMNSEEATMSRKTKGKGPGGCKGKEECEVFCQNPENQETCFNFGKENGLIPQEDLDRMGQEKQRFKEELTRMPEEVRECLKTSLGSESVERFMNGSAMPNEGVGDNIKQCFESVMGEKGRGPGEMGPKIPSQDGAGPEIYGTVPCTTPEECQIFESRKMEEMGITKDEMKRDEEFERMKMEERMRMEEPFKRVLKQEMNPEGMDDRNWNADVAPEGINAPRPFPEGGEQNQFGPEVQKQNQYEFRPQMQDQIIKFEPQPMGEIPPGEQPGVPVPMIPPPVPMEPSSSIPGPLFGFMLRIFGPVLGL